MSDNNDLCTWAYKSKKMREYHDTEWGRPLHDEISLFGLFVLETFQAIKAHLMKYVESGRIAKFWIPDEYILVLVHERTIRSRY